MTAMGPTAVVMASPEVAAVHDGVVTEAVSKVWCSKCLNDKHNTKECQVPQYCYICDKFNHVTWRCHVLKQPKPVINMCGVGASETVFYALPDSLFKENLTPTANPNALISVSGEGTVEAMDVVKEIARLVPAHAQIGRAHV